jgi:hypothetical protein
MTCKSCEYTRPEQCAKGLALWPSGSPHVCHEFIYLPGSDEKEDDVPDL